MKFTIHVEVQTLHSHTDRPEIHDLLNSLILLPDVRDVRK